MGLCRFFQTGSCRYGAKCHNEHFDVKQYLKSDMESGLNGKMWPFSGYGPFKDKPNFPNFIEDQSFEEVRFLCYEAKKTNNFEQFHQQFNREVVEATNKMKAMLQMSPQILDIMIKIYDTPEGANVSQSQPNNPFAAVPATNPSASIFGKPALSSGNIFGGGTAQANNTNSIFGGAMGGGNTGTGIFGGGAASGNTGNGIFGGGAANATNPFGAPQQQPAAQAFQGGNLFNQAPGQAFGGFQQQQQAQPSGVFGQPANSNQGIFSQAVQQQPQQPPSGLFANASAAFPTQQQQQLQMQQQQQQQQMHMQQHPQQQQQQQMQMQQHLQQQQQQQQMQMQQHQQQQNMAHSSVFSRMEDLSAAEIEAFKAEQFLPGHLPFNPPPREFC
ncbi:hypothetical protein KR074_001935 [Drosophila pseudoananassae]|nr:hypothetical protein KR074_001935 [Drosophila pseudoananassae]